MNIFVKGISDGIASLEVDPSHTIDDLRCMVAAKGGYGDPSVISLVYSSRYLDLEKKIGDAVPKDATLFANYGYSYSGLIRDLVIFCNGETVSPKFVEIETKCPWCKRIEEMNYGCSCQLCHFEQFYATVLDSFPTLICQNKGTLTFQIDTNNYYKPDPTSIIKLFNDDDRMQFLEIDKRDSLIRLHYKYTVNNKRSRFSISGKDVRMLHGTKKTNFNYHDDISFCLIGQ